MTVAATEDELSIPECARVEQGVILSRKISAVRLIRKSVGIRQVMDPVELSPETFVHVCGFNRNPRTIKVRAGEEYFLVFRRDLEASIDLSRLD
jgi:hypothetical protein